MQVTIAGGMGKADKKKGHGAMLLSVRALQQAAETKGAAGRGQARLGGPLALGEIRVQGGRAADGLSRWRKPAEGKRGKETDRDDGVLVPFGGDVEGAAVPPDGGSVRDGG